MDKNNDKADAINPYEKDEMAEFNEEPDIPTQKVKNTVKYGTEIGEPPLTVVIQGGSGSGKTTLIRSLIKYYNNQNISNVIGSVTVRTSKNQRLTFYECSNDISSLIIGIKKYLNNELPSLKEQAKEYANQFSILTYGKELIKIYESIEEVKKDD